MNPEEELGELKRKYNLLEGDRKAYFETAQWTMKQNKETVQSVKEENKELRRAIAQIQKDTTGATPPENREIAQLEQKIVQTRKQHNEVKHAVTDADAQLKQLTDRLRDLEKECEPAVTEDSPVTRQIRMLENRLDKAMIKYNEAQSIRKTYEQIVKRLKEERIGFDNQLAAIERTLKAKQHDYEELAMMSHDATHARDVARNELAQFKQYAEEQRKQREKDLAEKKSAVNARLEMTKRLSEKLEEKEKEKAGGQDYEEGKAKKDAQAEELRASAEAKKIQEAEERISKYERMFRTIKEATGVSDVNQVIEKFLTQETTHRKLQELTKEAQEKIDQLNDEKGRLKQEMDELKFTGPGSLGSRRIVEEFEQHLSEANSKCEKNKKKYERIAKTLIDVKAGIEHLADKLELIKLDVPEVPMNADTTVEVLAQCEQKLVKVVETVNASKEEITQAPEASMMSEATAVDTSQNNIRIKLPAGEEEESGEEYISSEGEEEVMDRDQMKRLARLAVEKSKKKPKKKKGKKGEANISSLSGTKGKKAELD